ncbi:uncharacterized protein LOC124644283 isoform X2 [Helicoverpa zea]|uniref:uncharacterized protein LOC124644283 isoform X2 n=1 Tax=Helicoverpa zea TaxID=7113 RepID=UPI001F5A840D|nr:uncharacterized protein LOC124644283 isoform X2 [Helicoverpa zea]
MPSCALIYCNTRYGTTTGPNCGLFSFPKLNRQEREKWVKFVQSERGEKKWLPSAASKLCSKHFKKDDIYRGKTGRLMLKKGAVPYSREVESANITRKVCPSCHATLPDSFQATQSRHKQVRSIIAKVYHFLEREYEQLKSLHPETDWSPLSRVRQRAAVATGVSEPDVLHILSEESDRLVAEKKPPNKRARNAHESSSDDDYDDDDDDGTSNDDDDSDKQTEDLMEESSVYIGNVKSEANPLQETEPETLIIKKEPKTITNDSVPEKVCTKRERPNKPKMQDINGSKTNSSAVEACRDDIVRRDKQTTISQPAPHVHTQQITKEVSSSTRSSTVDNMETSSEDPLMLLTEQISIIQEEGIS